MKPGSARLLIVIASVIGGIVFRAGAHFGGWLGGLLASSLLLVAYLAIWGAIRAATPGDDVHGKVLSAEAAWWQTSPGLRFSLFTACVWLIGSYVMQDSYDMSWSLVLCPPAFLIAVYFGLRGVVVGPAPERQAARVLNHLKAVERRRTTEEPTQEAVAAVAQAEVVRDMTPAERRRAMDELIGKMG